MQIAFQLEVIDECNSTNDFLINQRDENFHGRAIMAKKQSSGQGRRGRVWQSGQGNLALSVGFRLKSPELVALFPFTAGIAIAKVLDRLPVRLKWPNDIYLNGKKLGGILCLARQQGSSVDLVLGLGINIKNIPDLTLDAISLSDVGFEIQPEAFAQLFLSQWASALKQIEDFAWVKREWERYAKINGARLMILDEGIECEGLGIMASGELEVICDGITRLLASEEISVRFI